MLCTAALWGCSITAQLCDHQETPEHSERFLQPHKRPDPGSKRVSVIRVNRVLDNMIFKYLFKHVPHSAAQAVVNLFVFLGEKTLKKKRVLR